MNTARFGGTVFAVVLLCLGGVTLSQLASSQDNQPAKKATEKSADQKKQETPPKSEKDRLALSKFMRMKLEASQKILAGLALEDLDLIQEGAAKLDEMSTAEKWRVSNDPFFREHSHDFQRITQRLTKNAKDGKLEASALVWLEATMQCIECHKWTRANLIARDK